MSNKKRDAKRVGQVRRLTALMVIAILLAVIAFAGFRCQKKLQDGTFSLLSSSSEAPPLVTNTATPGSSSSSSETLAEATTAPTTEPPTEPPTDPPTEPPTEPDESWKLTLVNRWNKLPEDSSDISLVSLSNGNVVDARIYPDLQAMFDAARAQGLSPMVREGYRTHADQQAMMDEYINRYLAEGCTDEEARQKAESYVAIPGTSEHELGLAVDINSTTDDAWPLYNWLAANAHEYGFILRYPDGKTSITGIDYEPWHYRYVGKEAAAEIYARQITLEEYLQ